MKYIQTEKGSKMVVTKPDIALLDRAMDKFRLAAQWMGLETELNGAEDLYSAIVASASDAELPQDDAPEDVDDEHDVPSDELPV